jgi:hypothetical protein
MKTIIFSVLGLILAVNALLTVPYAVVAANGGSGSYTGAPGGTKSLVSFTNIDYAGSAVVTSTTFGPSAGSANLQFAKLDIVGNVTSNCPGINTYGVGVNGNVDLYRLDTNAVVVTLASVGTVTNQAFSASLPNPVGQTGNGVPYVIPSAASYEFRTFAAAGISGGSTSCTVSVSGLTFVYSVIGSK